MPAASEGVVEAGREPRRLDPRPAAAVAAGLPHPHRPAGADPEWRPRRPVPPAPEPRRPRRGAPRPGPRPHPCREAPARRLVRPHRAARPRGRRPLRRAAPDPPRPRPLTRPGRPARPLLPRPHAAVTRPGSHPPRHRRAASLRHRPRAVQASSPTSSSRCREMVDRERRRRVAVLSPRRTCPHPERARRLDPAREWTGRVAAPNRPANDPT